MYQLRLPRVSYVALILLTAICTFPALTISMNTKEVIFTVSENTPIGALIGNIRNHLSHEQINKQFFLFNEQYFTLEPSGDLRVKSELDRDDDSSLCDTRTDSPQQCVWTGLISAPQDDSIGIKVIIRDENDHQPAWSQKEILLEISEESERNTLKELPLAEDRDSGINGITEYRIANKTNYFTIETTVNSVGIPVPKLRVVKRLDREHVAWHNLTLLVIDGAEPFHTGSVPLNIRVLDENDNSPIFPQSVYNVSIREDLDLGTVLDMNVTASDADENMNEHLRYEFSLSTQKKVLEHFRIDSETGMLSIRRALNYDAFQPSFTFTIIAVDHGQPPKTGEALVHVHIVDTNNNAPEITVHPFGGSSSSGSRLSSGALNMVRVEENLPADEVIAMIYVKDRDTGEGGEFNCKLTPEDNFQLVFSKDVSGSKIYNLKTKRKFDREERNVERVMMSCEDHGEPKKVGKEFINVRILDVNDNPPKFPQRHYSLHIAEGNEPGAVINFAPATDLDEGNNANLTYLIEWVDTRKENPFEVNSAGQLRVLKTLDRETDPDGFAFKLIVTDLGSPQMSDVAEMEVKLLDVNDCVPTFDEEEYEFTINEHEGDRFTMMTVGRVRAVDNDTGMNSEIEYRLLPEESLFQIEQDGFLRTSQLIDREKADRHKLVIIAVDKPVNIQERKTGSVTVTVIVQDLNDNAPIFVSATTTPIRVSYKEAADTLITRVLATDADVGKNRQVVYSISGGNLYGLFHIKEHTGEIFLREMMDQVHKGNIDLQVTASDLGLPRLFNTTTVPILVDDSPPKSRSAHSSKHGSFGEGLETNQLIILSIVVITSIICAILITAICIMARRTSCGSRRRQQLRHDFPPTPSKMMALTSNFTGYPSEQSQDPPGAWVKTMDGRYHLPPDLSGIMSQNSDRTMEYINNKSDGMDSFLNGQLLTMKTNSSTIEEVAPPPVDSDEDSGRGGSMNNNHTKPLLCSMCHGAGTLGNGVPCQLCCPPLNSIYITSSTPVSMMTNNLPTRYLPCLNETIATAAQWNATCTTPANFCRTNQLLISQHNSANHIQPSLGLHHQQTTPSVMFPTARNSQSHTFRVTADSTSLV